MPQAAPADSSIKRALLLLVPLAVIVLLTSVYFGSRLEAASSALKKTTNPAVQLRVTFRNAAGEQTLSGWMTGIDAGCLYTQRKLLTPHFRGVGLTDVQSGLNVQPEQITQVIVDTPATLKTGSCRTVKTLTLNAGLLPQGK